MEVDRAPPNAIAAGVADDDAAEPGEERPQEHEAGAHLGCRLEWHEQPLDVAGGDLVVVFAGVVDHDADVAERFGHDPHVLDLRHIREPAALTCQRGGGEQLEGGILRAADANRARQRLAALDAKDLARDRLRVELPVKRSGVSH